MSRSRSIVVACVAVCALSLGSSATPMAAAEISRSEAYGAARGHARAACKDNPTCLRGEVVRCRQRGNNLWACKNLLLGLLPVICTYRVDVFIKGDEITTSRAYDSRC